MDSKEPDSKANKNLDSGFPIVHSFIVFTVNEQENICIAGSIFIIVHSFNSSRWLYAENFGADSSTAFYRSAVMLLLA